MQVWICRIDRQGHYALFSVYRRLSWPADAHPARADQAPLLSPLLCSRCFRNKTGSFVSDIFVQLSQLWCHTSTCPARPVGHQARPCHHHHHHQQQHHIIIISSTAAAAAAAAENSSLSRTSRQHTRGTYVCTLDGLIQHGSLKYPLVKRKGCPTLV